MTQAPDQRRATRRGIFMMLAALAVAIKVLIPAGFMTAKSPALDLPFALVLCTAQGAVVVESDGLGLPAHDQDQDRSGGVAHDSPCAFAGHAAGAPPPKLLDVRNVEFVAHLAPAAVQAVHFAPGRGLAAPPPPARGPPAQLI